jgi:hypothetical protein
MPNKCRPTILGSCRGEPNGCAPKQRMTTPAARQRPRPDAENFDGEVSFEPPSRFTSLDRLVGERQQFIRHVEAECLRRPEVYDTLREFASAGGLIAYGPDLPEVYRLTGGYAGRILRGDKPADVPVLLPTKFEMIALRGMGTMSGSSGRSARATGSAT